MVRDIALKAIVMIARECSSLRILMANQMSTQAQNTYMMKSSACNRLSNVLY